MADRDYYEVLGVKRDASADQIKKAYRGLARKHHPDANPGDKTAEAKFKEVQNAYDILSDSEKKTRYDQFGHAAFEGFGSNGPRSGASEWAARAGGGASGVENIDFSQFFNVRPGAGPVEEEHGGGIFDEILTRMRGDRSGRRKPARPAEAAEAAITIPFLTAVRGGETSIELERDGGRRETKVVRIPPGLESGSKLRLKGQGDPSGAIDLILTVSVEAHPFFTRNGRDLAVEVPISVSEAILGARVEVPTLDGSTKSLPIPPGTSGGRRLRLKGQGVPASKTAPEGDLYLVIKVVVPPKVDDESREMIEKFAALNPSNPRQGLW